MRTPIQIRFALIFVITAMAASLTASAQNRGAIAAAAVAKGPTVPVKAGLSFSLSGEHALRIIWAETNGDMPLNPALMDVTAPKPVLELKPDQTVTRAKVGSFRVTVTAEPDRIVIEDAKGRRIQELEFHEDNSDERSNHITFLMDGPILGLGEGGDQYDRKGFNFPPTRGGQVMNGQVYKLGELGTRITVPFLLGTKGWALFFSSPYGTFDLRGDRGQFTSVQNAKPGGQADIFVVDASEPEYAMNEFILLSGAPAMPPKYTLGYQQSHRTLSNEKDLMDELKLFRDQKLPCDMMIYLGTGFCTNGWNINQNNEQETFEPNPVVFTRSAAEVFKDMHDMHFHVALHIVPLQRTYPTLHGQIPPAPGEDVDSRDINSYWKRHEPLVADGVDGWWPDEGDWFDVPSRLARMRMYYQGPLSDHPNVRPWDLQRNGYAGMSQFGGWYWSGDIQSTWATLAAHVEVGLNASLSVSPFWGTDIGGFYPANSREYTGELYTRWFQFATFCPLFRSHGRTWRLHSPWGWDTGITGVVESRPAPPESELHNAAVEPICRDYLNLRYQLMPYTYTITREARDTGMPLMRALWLHYPDDAKAVAMGSEYLWGRDILVAPVTEHAATNRVVYLPKGDWYDWWTSEKTAGGQDVTKAVDLKTMPLYVRAGAIVPFDPVRQYTDEPVSGPTTLRVYRGADGHFVMYDDDGISQEYLKPGTGTWTEMTWNDRSKRLEIKLDKRTKSSTNAARKFDVLLLPDNVHKQVDFTGRSVTVRF